MMKYFADSGMEYWKEVSMRSSAERRADRVGSLKVVELVPALLPPRHEVGAEQVVLPHDTG